MTLLLDIDGVVCEPQQPMSMEMSEFLAWHDVYFVTGNSFEKAIDLVHSGKIFYNNADELRQNNKVIWADTETPALDPGIEDYLYAYPKHKKHYGNRIEWRGRRCINFSMLGRFAPHAERVSHDAGWRDQFINDIKKRFDVEAVKGGQISVDIYSKGADKSRAGKYLLTHLHNTIKENLVFIGDKTDLGGNDYPLVKFCEENNLSWFKSSGPEHTMDIIKSLC